MTKKIILALFLGLFIGPVHAKPKEKPRTYHVCTAADTPENILACAMYFEARSEGEKGMNYVGNVILNRRNHDEYPSKIKKVVYQKHQFSYVRSKLKVQDKISWDLAQKVSKRLLSLSEEKRRLTDPSKGAIFFSKAGKRTPWAKSYQKTVSYGKHNFYRERKKK